MLVNGIRITVRLVTYSEKTVFHVLLYNFPLIITKLSQHGRVEKVYCGVQG